MKNDIPIRHKGSTVECSQPKGIKPKMREHKLGNGVNWQGVLKRKGVKQGLGV